MTFKPYHIDYRDTASFSDIVLDYLESDRLSSFYAYRPTEAEIQQVIRERSHFSCDRDLLVDVLKRDYEGYIRHEKTISNIEALVQPNTYTVCTAHQPCLFMGPLYVVYKIAHAIRLADDLNSKYSNYKFVPVFYMGSEDADIDELGTVTIFGSAFKWKTSQKGAVGRMLVDEHLIKLIDDLAPQLSVYPFGNKMLESIRRAYVTGVTIQCATFTLLNEWFGVHGLVILLPDNPRLKKAFAPFMRRELEASFSSKEIEQTLANLSDRYEIQAAGREINLFHLDKGHRERIIRHADDFVLAESGKRFSAVDMFRELDTHPEKFSPNVILRPLYQEYILPNLVSIGGGAELAYWLELKSLFRTCDIHYPMLLLRNSFMIISGTLADTIRGLNLKPEDFFVAIDRLQESYIRKVSNSQVTLDAEIQALKSIYVRLHAIAVKTDKGLEKHVPALQAKALNRIQQLEMKLIKAEKRKYIQQMAAICSIKDALFPKGKLQERVESGLSLLSVYGPHFIETLVSHSGSFSNQFCILVEE